MNELRQLLQARDNDQHVLRRSEQIRSDPLCSWGILVGVFERVPGQSWCQDGKSDFRVLEFKGITCCQDLTPQKLFLQSEPEGVFRICRYHLSWGTAQDSANYSYAFLAVGLWFDMVWLCLILQLGPFLAHGSGTETMCFSRDGWGSGSLDSQDSRGNPPVEPSVLPHCPSQTMKGFWEMRSENRLSDSPTDSPCSNNKNPLIPHFYCLGPHFPSGWIFLQHSAASFGRRQGPVALRPSSAPGGHRLRRGTDLVPWMGWKWMTCRIYRKKMQKRDANGPT